MENQADITRYITRATNRNAIIGKLAVYALTATLLILIPQFEWGRKYMILFAIGIIIIMSAVVRLFSVEYEYRLSGGNFSVDCVYGVTKRVTKLDIEIGDITEDVACASDEFGAVSEKADKVFDFSSSEKAEGRHFFLVEKERIGFILEADEEFLGAMKKEKTDED